MDICTDNSATLRTTTVLCKPFYQRKFAPFRYRATAHTHTGHRAALPSRPLPAAVCLQQIPCTIQISASVLCAYAQCTLRSASPTALPVVVCRIASRTSTDTDPTLTLTDLTPRPTTMALCLRRWCELDPPPLLPADTGLEG